MTEFTDWQAVQFIIKYNGREGNIYRKKSTLKKS